MTTKEVRIPDIGDIDEVEVIELCVSEGDEVGPDDPLIVIESDKASMDVPAGVSGRVASVNVAVGDRVTEGTLVVTLEVDEPETDETAPDTGTATASLADETVQAEADASADVEDPQTDEAASTGTGAGRNATGTRQVEVRVPDIGEATGVEVIEVGVQPGDTVTADDLLVVVESDKASMEIPAGYPGKVVDVHVGVGSQVEEGTLLATIETTASEPDSTEDEKTHRAAEPAEVSDARREAAPEQPPPPAERPSAVPPPGEPAGDSEQKTDRKTDKRVYAGPAVRRLARELGVSLADVKGTGNRGRILKEDVKAHVKSVMSRGRDSAAAGGIPPLPEVDFSRFGPVEVVPLSRIRATGAANLHRSWLNLPHVTQFEEADVTELEAFRATLKEEAERRGVKLTPLAFIIKACCHALQAFPTFNASLDPAARHFILKRYYHIGIAVDTEDGLVVPVIRNADQLGVWALSEAITELAGKAREKKLGMNDLTGGTFSVSSLGNIGGTGFTPIINAPEVAILGVSKLATRPVWNGSEFEPRKLLPLSLSYDHRAINGAEAGRFMALLTDLLGDIRRLAL